MAAQITPDLLEALLSPDAARRGEAESYLQGIPLVERASGLVSSLVQSSTKNHHATLAAVLLRRDILRLTDVPTMEPMVGSLLECFLRTNCPCRVSIGNCLAEICGAVAVLSPSPKDKEQVMTRILNTISNAVSQGDIASLRLLAAMAERAPNVFVNTALPSLYNLIQQVTSSQQLNADLLGALMEVVVNGAIATLHTNQDTPIIPYATQFTDKVDSSSSAAELGRTCLPLLFDPLSTSLDGSSSCTLNVMQQWTNAASTCPSLLAGDKSVLKSVVFICLRVANTRNGDTAVVLAALEVLSCLCFVGDVKRKVLGVDPALRQYILQGDSSMQGVVALTAQYMISGCDDNIEGWATEVPSLQDDDEWEGDDDAVYAESLLQSFLHSLAGSALVVALPLIEKLLQPNEDWRCARTALSMLEACLSCAPVAFSAHNPVAVEAALNLAGTQQPIRVQYQALQLLGVLCETDAFVGDSTETVRQHYGHRILQTLAQAVQSPCRKISALASLAIASFCRGGSSEKGNDDEHPVVPYLSDLLQALVAGPLSLDIFRNNSIDHGAVVVKIRSIGAVACLAEAGGERFVPFYGTIMPGLLGCFQLQPRHNQEVSQLIGTAIESATVVGQAIESDDDCRTYYVRDAEKIMQFIVPFLEQADLESSDAYELPLGPLLAACARIASVLKGDYAPFMKVVLPLLLRRAATSCDVSVSDGEEADLKTGNRHVLEFDEDLGTESLTVAMPGLGLKKYSIHTSKIQEKTQAARAVYEHAIALEGTFDPSYVRPCLETFLPLINFQFSAEVRSMSAQAVAAVFEVACCCADESVLDPSALHGYFPMILKTVAKQIQSESITEVEALYALADSLSEVNYSVYQRLDTYSKPLASSVSFDGAGLMVGMVIDAISACLKRRHDIYSILSGGNGALTGEDERHECEEQLRDEEKLLTPLVDSIGYTLKFLKHEFVPIFQDKVAPVLEPCLTNGDLRARLCAVCLYDDCVEHCGPAAAAKYAEKLVYGVILGIDDQSNGGDLELKSASIYGVSQMCRYSPSSVLAPHLETILYHLMKVAASPKEDSKFPMMYENAVSALASLVLIGNAPFASSESIKRKDMIKCFVENLPLREDSDEAKICHSGFCDLVENGSIDLQSNAVDVLQIIGETLAYVSEGETIASQDTCTRLAGILVHMQQTLPSDLINKAFMSISANAQNGINSAMCEN